MHGCVLGLLAAAGMEVMATALVPGGVLAAVKQSPEFVAPEQAPIPKGTRVDVVAGRLTFDGKTEIATATGLVRLTYGPYVLTATRVVYDMKRGKFSANGSIVLREPNGNVLEADFAELDDKFREGFARHVKALLTNDVTITARYARRYENGITIYEQANYTACKTCIDEGGRPLWQIVAREAKHDMEEHTIYYRDARLEIGGVPVFYTPYLAYPDPSVKRRSGFLLPSFHGGAFGLGVTTPYFWAVAPNQDLTFSPMWTTQQGVLADLEWRHRLQSGIYSIRGYGIHELDPGDTSASDGPWRGAVRSKGSFRIDDAWSWGWDGTFASDRAFLDDYGLDSRDMATSYVQATQLAGRNYAKVQAIHYRTLTEDEEQDRLPTVLPFVTANYIFADPVAGGELSFDFNAYSLRRFALGTEQTHAVGIGKWQRQMIGDGGLLLTPFTELRSDVYVSENGPGADESGDADTYLRPSAGFDMRMPFIAGHDTSQSVLTPVLQMIAAPAEQRDADNANEDAITLNFDTTSLFLSDRFTSFDRYEGGVRANAGLTYTLLRNNGGFLRASFGESFHVAGENSFAVGSGLDGTSSDLVGALALQMNENVTFGYQARVEEDLSRINVQEASLGLTFDRISGSLSYADVAAAANYGRRFDEQQVWGDSKYKLGEAWSLIGGFRYDIEGNHFMEKTVGVMFECDCMNAQLSYSQDRADDGGTEHRLELGVELRTLGGVDGGFNL